MSALYCGTLRLPVGIKEHPEYSGFLAGWKSLEMSFLKEFALLNPFVPGDFAGHCHSVVL